MPTRRRQWPTVQRFVKLLFDRGVHLTVGTDTPNPWTAPGTSFHRELELLANAGIPARDLLRMATLAGAEATGREGDIGSIALGKRADLVLLDADPLADIRNTRRISRVVVGGRIFLPNEVLPARLQAGAPGTAPPRKSTARLAPDAGQPPA